MLHVKFYAFPSTFRGVLGKGFNAVIRYKSLSEFFDTLFKLSRLQDARGRQGKGTLLVVISLFDSPHLYYQV